MNIDPLGLSGWDSLGYGGFREICQQAGSAVHYLTPQEAAGVIHNMETMHNVYNPLSKYVFGISVGSTITGIAGTSFGVATVAEKGSACIKDVVKSMIKDGERDPTNLALTCGKSFINEGDSSFQGNSKLKDNMKKNILMMVFTVIVLFGGVIAWLYHSNDSLENVSANSDIAHLTKLAEQGDMKAQTDLGLAYGSGNSIPQDYTKAMYWYNQAAKQGYAPAQFNLGLFYENGWGGSRDLQLAKEFYRKAANQGFTNAQINLGILFMDGKGGGLIMFKPENYL
nr:tetratricopeptide repeat protein [Salmonella enterica]